MVIDNAYEIGDTVYLVTDSCQSKRIIISILVYKGGEIMYKLSCGILASDHYAFEITRDADVLTRTTN